MLNIQDIKNQFPIFSRRVNGKRLVYLDNASSSQKPAVVLRAWEHYYKNTNSNVHRGVHTLSQQATEEMELSRKKIQHFINAKNTHEIIFTKGTTEGINLIAYSISPEIRKDDEIIISYLEHHSNIVPWQMLCERTGAKLRVIPMDQQGVLQIDILNEWLSEKTRLVSINQVSNALGIINPIEEIIAKVRKQSTALVAIDGAQSVSHFKIDVQKMDCDFFVFSGHKMYAPMGTGVLYGKEEVLSRLQPFHGGGEMIETCSFDRTTYAELPFLFEAGTPNVGGNIALGVAIDFMNSLGRENILFHENNLIEYAQRQLSGINNIEIYGESVAKTGVISFNIKKINGNAFDVGMILDKLGIVVRTGHHCAQPIMKFLGIEGTVRASFAIYNDKGDVDSLLEGVERAVEILK